MIWVNDQSGLVTVLGIVQAHFGTPKMTKLHLAEFECLYSIEMTKQILERNLFLLTQFQFRPFESVKFDINGHMNTQTNSNTRSTKEI